MERTVYRTFDNGTYRVELDASGDTDNFAPHADSIMTGVTSTLDSYVLPTVSLAVAAQASQPASEDSTAADVDDSVEATPAPVRSANPVVETVKVSLHGVDVTLVVVVELNTDLTTDVLDLREIVRNSVTSITSMQINAAIVNAVLLDATVQVPIFDLFGGHDHHDALAHLGGSFASQSDGDSMLSGLLSALHGPPASRRSGNPFDDDLFSPFDSFVPPTTRPSTTTTRPQPA